LRNSLGDAEFFSFLCGFAFDELFTSKFALNDFHSLFNLFEFPSNKFKTWEGQESTLLVLI